MPVQLAIDCPSQKPSNLSIKSPFEIELSELMLQEIHNRKSEMYFSFISKIYLILLNSSLDQLYFFSIYIIEIHDISITNDGAVGMIGSEILK